MAAGRAGHRAGPHLLLLPLTDMTTDPKKAREARDQRRPSGAESKGAAHGASGGERSRAGSDYGDWVPDRTDTRRNDDIDADEARMGRYPRSSGDPMNLPPQPGSPQA